MKRVVKENYILFCILIAALVIRIIGLVPGYSTHHPDEGIFSSSAINMLINGDFNPGRYDYPAGVSLIHYFVYSQFILPIIFFKLFFSHPEIIFTSVLSRAEFFNDFRVEIFGNREIYALFWSRHITAILGAITVLVTYIATSKLFDKKTGLFAAFFLAFNYRHVYSSHFALSDVPNSLFAILTFLGCVFLFKKNSLRNYLLTGFFLGVYFSMKYQIFPVVSLLLIHLYWVFKQKKLLTIFDKKVFLTVFLMLLVFSIANIHIFFNLQVALKWIDLVSSRYGAGSNNFNFYPLYYLFYWGIGILPFIAIVLGLIFSLFLFPLRSLLVLSFILPFFYILLYYMSGGTYVRNFTTVMPFLMIFAGLFFSITLNFLQKIFKKKSFLSLVIVLLLVFVVNLEPIKNSLTLSINYLRPWNRAVLVAWAQDKLPEKAKIANDNLGLDYDDTGFIHSWNLNESNSIAELQEGNYDFAVYNTDWRQSLLHWWFGINPRELIRYKNLPYEILDNSYNGIALQEFSKSLVFEVYKDWQAPDINYFVAKIPPKLENVGRQIYSFEFDKSEDGWHTIDINNNTGIKGLNWDQEEGNANKGSLVYKEIINSYKMARYTSKLLSVKPGKVYTVTGFFKIEDKLLKARERDGFLRADFYEENIPEKIGGGGISRSVSARVYGASNWVEKQITVKAPQNAHFLAVSFQKDFYGGRVWLDDVKIYEADKMPEKFPKVPYIKSTIPKEVLYPNSIL